VSTQPIFDAGDPVRRHDHVPPELDAGERNAAANCPEAAITVGGARR
jgi:ferredoxin